MINTEQKIKPMTLEELTLAIDRLTRFKLPEEKYNRVFKEIISKYQIIPKISFKDYEKLTAPEISSMVENIFTYSLNRLNPEQLENSLYKTVIDLEKSIYNINDDTLNLMDTKIPYENILKLNKNTPLCKNLELLKQMQNSGKTPTQIRKKFKTKFPLEKIIIAEGITEEILLPTFAKLLHYDFDENGIELIAAGGKNQVAKDYIKLKDALNIPIVILLDADAKTIAETISDKLREFDKLILIEKGEFEDILPLNLISKAINYKFTNFFKIEDNEFNLEINRVADLEEIYRINGLGEFKKAEFAHNIKDVLDSTFDISDEIEHIIKEIKNT